MARAEADTMQSAPAGVPPAPLTQESIDRRLASIADSLRNEIQRAVLDSISRERGPRPDLTAIVKSASALESLSKLAERFSRPDRRPNEPLRTDYRAVEIAPEAFAERAKNMGPSRRIFMSSPELRGPLGALGPAADSLMEVLRASVSRMPRFGLIDRDTARAALGKTRNISSISKTLDVELFAALYVSLQPDSSVIWTLTVRDLGAHPAFGTRSAVARGSVGALPGGTEAFITKATRYLDEIDHAPRRATGIPSRP